MSDVEVGMWVVPQPTFEAAGLDWQVVDIVGKAAILRWSDKSYRDVVRTRVERIDGFWNKYQTVN